MLSEFESNSQKFSSSDCSKTEHIFKDKEYVRVCTLLGSICPLHNYHIENPTFKKKFLSKVQTINCECYKELMQEYLNFQKELKNNSIESRLTLDWERPIKREGFVIGIPDFYFSINTFFKGHYLSGVDDFFGYVEVKPKILSVGETMRQIKLYKSYSRNAFFVLVTKTPDYKEVFERQGINYFVWKDNQKDLDDFNEHKELL
jgi:hypothetical protein